MTDHPITPPPELVQQWLNEEGGLTAGHIATRAARWGADQELEAIRQLLEINGCPSKFIDLIINARRPKPPSLKEQALAALDDSSARLEAARTAHEYAIRRALEVLSDD